MISNRGFTVLKIQEINDEPEIVLNIDGNIADGYHLMGWTEGGVKQAFHHELFHAADIINDEHDNWWVGIHPRGIDQYAKPAQKSFYLQHADKKLAGFARAYGKLNPKEDRATVFELLCSSEKEYNEDRGNDFILRGKTAALERYILNQSNGLMDNKYWIERRSRKKDFSIEYFREKAGKIINATYETYIKTLQFADNKWITPEIFGKWQTSLRKEYF